MARRADAPRASFVRVSVALLALTLVYALILAARNGLADVYAEPAKNFLQDKRDSGDTLTEAEWQVINANLQRALKLQPDNPVTLTELGRLHRIQLEVDTLERAEIERHGALALDYYERAARLRPTWPWGWSSMALVRYELFEDSSDAYHQALIRAARFGPWEGSIQRLIVDLGLDTWEHLSPGARHTVLVTVDRALKRQPDGLNAIVDAKDSWQTLCGAPADLSRLRRHCNDLAMIDDES